MDIIPVMAANLKVYKFGARVTLEGSKFQVLNKKEQPYWSRFEGCIHIHLLDTSMSRSNTVWT